MAYVRKVAGVRVDLTPEEAANLLVVLQHVHLPFSDTVYKALTLAGVSTTEATIELVSGGGLEFDTLLPF